MASYDITKLGSGLEFDTTSADYNNSLKIDDTHFVNIWRGGASSYIYARVFTVNKTTGAVTTAGGLFTVSSSGYNSGISAFMADGNHFIVSWDYSTFDGATRAFEINTSTWDITAKGTMVTFGSNEVNYTNSFLLDSTHYVLTWNIVSILKGQIFEINTSTWDITAKGTPTLIRNDDGGVGAPAGKRIDDTNFIITYGSKNSGACALQAKVITVNTSTWAFTMGDPVNLIFGSSTDDVTPSIEKIDSTHFIYFSKGTDNDGYVRVLSVNTTDRTITNLGTSVEFDTSNLIGRRCSSILINDNHVVLLWQGGASFYGYIQTFEINLSTWQVSINGSSLLLQSNYCDFLSCLLLDTGLVIGTWKGTDDDGYTQLFEIELPELDTGNMFLMF